MSSGYVSYVITFLVGVTFGAISSYNIKALSTNQSLSGPTIGLKRRNSNPNAQPGSPARGLASAAEADSVGTSAEQLSDEEQLALSHLEPQGTDDLRLAELYRDNVKGQFHVVTKEEEEDHIDSVLDKLFPMIDYSERWQAKMNIVRENGKSAPVSLMLTFESNKDTDERVVDSLEGPGDLSWWLSGDLMIDNKKETFLSFGLIQSIATKDDGHWLTVNTVTNENLIEELFYFAITIPNKKSLSIAKYLLPNGKWKTVQNIEWSPLSDEEFKKLEQGLAKN